MRQALHTDIPRQGWIARLPDPWRAYAQLMRLDRPVGVWLLFFPCVWSVVLATQGGTVLPPWLIVQFLAGALVMRGAGCVVNDSLDARFDAQVERTRLRPIPSGRISRRHAAGLLAVLLLIALAILLQFNRPTVLWALPSLVLLAVYPLMKRITWWPQAFLGFTFNYGALLGWTAVQGQMGWPAVALYLTGVAWTLGYDTIYAQQDVEDDQLVGVLSTARLWGRERVRGFVAICFGVTAVGLALAAWLAGNVGGAVLAFLASLHLVWQVARWNVDDPMSSLKIFKSNRDFAALLVVAYALGWGLTPLLLG